MKNKNAKIIFIIYIFLLLYLTLFRNRINNINLFGGEVNFVLFKEYIPLFRNNKKLFIYYFTGNIIWFIPFGYYLNKYKEINLRKTILYSFLFSLFIESIQFILGIGIFELDDLLLNTLGSLIGYLFASLIKKLTFSQ